MTMRPDEPPPAPPGDDVAGALQDGLDPIDPDCALREALWRRIARRTGPGLPLNGHAGTAPGTIDPRAPGPDPTGKPADRD